MTTPSLYAHHYFLSIIDDHSRYTWIFPMKFKSEARTLVCNFYAFISTQFHTKIKCIKSDNGKEFLMPDFYASNGIIHQTLCIHTPEQNSIVE